MSGWLLSLGARENPLANPLKSSYSRSSEQHGVIASGLKGICSFFMLTLFVFHGVIASELKWKYNVFIK